MDEKKDVSKELEKIQKECPHRDGYDVKFAGASNDVRKICKTCGAVIGYPSKQDLRDNGFNV